MAHRSDEDCVGKDAAALVFNPDGSYEVWLPKAPTKDGSASHGTTIVTAIACAIEEDPAFLSGALDQLRAKVEKQRAEN
jgi:hypothetical protein